MSILETLHSEQCLFIDFENSKKVPPSIAHKRSGVANYFGNNVVMSVAGVDTPRIDHDFDGSAGYLIEAARTNTLTHSANLAASTWVTSSFSTTAVEQAELAPTGDKAFAISTIADAPVIYHRHFVNSKNIGDYCFSIFVKRGGCRYAVIDFSNYGAQVRSNFTTLDFETGIVRGRNVPNDLQRCGVVNYPNGWYRIWMNTEFTAAPTVVNIGFADDPQLVNNVTQPKGSILGYAASAMVELGRNVTSYIRTNGASAARAADDGIIVPYESGEHYTCVATYDNCIARSQNVVTFLRDTTEIGSMKGGISTGRFGHYVRDIVQSQDIGSSAEVPSGVRTTHAFTVSADKIASYNNHTRVVWHKERNSISRSFNTMRIGLNASGGTYSGRFRKLLVIPRHSSNEQLIALCNMLHGA